MSSGHKGFWPRPQPASPIPLAWSPAGSAGSRRVRRVPIFAQPPLVCPEQSLCRRGHRWLMLGPGMRPPRVRAASAHTSTWLEVPRNLALQRKWQIGPRPFGGRPRGFTLAYSLLCEARCWCGLMVTASSPWIRGPVAPCPHHSGCPPAAIVRMDPPSPGPRTAKTPDP